MTHGRLLGQIPRERPPCELVSPRPGLDPESGPAPSASKRRQIVRFFARAGECLLVLAVFALAAEVTARLDDWLRMGTPFWSTPDRVRDLTTRDELGVHGRSHGRYLNWKLNGAGFRGPEIEVAPPPRTVRIAVIGSSEAFGLTESDGAEFPAQLAAQLGPRFEVVNAAMPGMTVRSMLPYWQKWLSRFKPAVVIVYPSPLFYLGDDPPGAPSVGGEPPAPPFQPRMVFRLKQRFHLPEFVHNWRVAREVAAHTSHRDPSWLFQSPPADRLEQFGQDVDKLLAGIEAAHARPLLVTHALRTARPTSAKDWGRLEAMRERLARATAQTIVEFEHDANDALRSIAQKDSLPLVDADRVLSGHEEYFGDQMHFSDAGARAMSQSLSKAIQDAL